MMSAQKRKKSIDRNEPVLDHPTEHSKINKMRTNENDLPTNSTGKKISWIHVPQVKIPMLATTFQTTKKSDTSPVKTVVSEKTENQSDNVDSKAKYSFDMSKQMTSIASTLKSTSNFDLFGPSPTVQKNPSANSKASSSMSRTKSPNISQPDTGLKSPSKGPKVTTSNESKDIFSASLTEVIFELGKDTIGLMKKPTLQTKSTSISSAAVPSKQPPKKGDLKPSIGSRKSISDMLELDRDTSDSPQLSTYHLESSKVLNDDDCGVISLPSEASYVNGVRVTSEERPINNSIFSKVEFMNTLTEFPEELLDERERCNSLSYVDEEAGTDPNNTFYKAELAYDCDDCV